MASWGIREAVRERVRQLSKEQLAGLLKDTQDKKEEKNLPGLGVFFELIWNKSDAQQREQLLQKLHSGLQEKTSSANDKQASRSDESRVH